MTPEEKFNQLVNWLHDDVIVRRQAPGFLVGLSGTDSLVTFIACYKAFEKHGNPNRVTGVHFHPSEDFIEEHPEANQHLWFKNEVIPWLRRTYPHATTAVNDTIDWRCDGLRWGMLADMSVVTVGTPESRRIMREPNKQYWVMGTRNKTEDVLCNYSNASTLASVQPIMHLWKTDILDICGYLGVPPIVTNKACETDCLCGRERLPANHPKEIDAILNKDDADWFKKMAAMDNKLRNTLSYYIDEKIKKNGFKREIPYRL